MVFVHTHTHTRAHARTHICTFTYIDMEPCTSCASFGTWEWIAGFLCLCVCVCVCAVASLQVSTDEQKAYMCELYERCLAQKQKTQQELADKYLQPLGKPRKVA